MLRAAHLIHLAVIALLGLAVVMVHSAAMRVGEDGRFSYLDMVQSRHTVYAGLAILAMLAATRINVRQFFHVTGWRNPLWWLLALSIGLVGLAMVPGVGRSVHGARRWLYLGPSQWSVSFQPSELLKWVMVLVIAWWCARRGQVMRRFTRGLLPPLVLVTAAVGLIVIEDLGTAVLIAVVASLMLFAGGARWWQMALLCPPGAAVVVAAIVSSPYRIQRLMAFMDPWADPQGNGYHPIQSMVTIAGGGLFGKGLGNSIQKFGYLPEDTTDFLFAVICEEMGICGAGLVVALILALLWVGFGIIQKCPDCFARLFGLGVLLTIGMQATINIAVVTVMMPTKGIALPLVSAGGTGWILTATCLGLIASLDLANWLDREAKDTDWGKLCPAQVHGT